ncbi:N-acetyl-D-Glu racemase DgcA [Vibrio mangrovi]|uniref:Dipeptide epimerase n=1 Tax=Vibrio mangrovi TaxID=474394 RepID=A0A1Y6IQN5_9VIBR|nr:N-acetyl-D-Glu racemase DgcA [Vibrio mangrovi]MDW6004389.1 N-acetyl-D-Glu racemase DgcA [Vibrio mangrovi]SMR98812.1 L-Ala-D/L-Glu epimerase [Vibrio mangrovi]
MNIRLYRKIWPIRGSFTISRGSKTSAETIIVEIEKNGVIGRGECVPYARYGESIEHVAAQIQGIFPEIKCGINRQQLQPLLPAGAARNAVDCAMWDLECKLSKQTIWSQLQMSPAGLTTAYTLSLDKPHKMEEAAVANAFRPLLKLKLGGPEDLERVRAVRRGAPQATIILDANEAWDVETYNALIPELEKLEVAMIEQPFHADDDAVLEGLARPIPICADESCHDRSSLSKVIGRYDMINIKTDKTGGLTEALALKQEAQDAGLRIMVGCMLSSSLSMAPAFVVAQGVEVVDLDGPLLLSQDIEHGFEFEKNQMLPFGSELWG